jgi:DNA-binding MarR family transcriptional regulator
VGKTSVLCHQLKTDNKTMANRSSGSKAKKTSPVSALHQLHRVSQFASDLFSSEMQSIKITPRQFTVLEAVMASEGLSQTDLVIHTGIDRSTIADIVRRMQSKGLLRRKRTKSDARVYAVSLTEKSRKIMIKAIPAAARADEKLLSTLSSAERSRLLQYLGKMAAEAENQDH